MLDTQCSEVVWRVLATHSILQFPLHFPSPESPCAITFQLDSTTLPEYTVSQNNIPQLCLRIQFRTNKLASNSYTHTNTHTHTHTQTHTGARAGTHTQKIVGCRAHCQNSKPESLSCVYWTVHHLGSWIKRDQLDVTCFIISLFNAQHVSDAQSNENHEITQQISRKLLRMDGLTSRNMLIIK